jgi:hypothetical protein
MTANFDKKGKRKKETTKTKKELLGGSERARKGHNKTRRTARHGKTGS